MMIYHFNLIMEQIMELQVIALKPEKIEKTELEYTTNFLKNRVINWLNKKPLPINVWISTINKIAFEVDMTYLINEFQSTGNKEQALKIIELEQMQYLEKLKTEINLWELNNE